MKNKNDYRNLSIEELANKEKELRKELFDLQFQLSSGKLSDTSLIKRLKKDIARIKTFTTLNKKQEDKIGK